MSNDGTMIGSNQNIAVRPFGLRDKFGYLCGDLGTCFILGLVNSFLMIYYTNVLGISGVIVGSLYFVTKLFDAFVDVGVGRLCDTSKLTAHGRFNPWVRRMKYRFASLRSFCSCRLCMIFLIRRKLSTSAVPILFTVRCYRQ